MSASAFLMDTSAYSAFNRGDARLKKWFDGNHTIFVPLIVAGELRAGFAAGSKTEENERLFGRFLDAPSVQTVSLSLKTTGIFASLFLNMRKNGTPIGTNDLWIASIAVEHSLPILTLDTDFKRVKEVNTIML